MTSVDFSSWLANNFFWLGQYAESAIVPGMIVTLKLFVYSACFGLPFAVVIGFGRISSSKVYFGISSAFVSVIRGTPLLVQMFIYYRGLGSIFPSIPGIRQTFIWPYLSDGFYYVVFALTLSVGAYVGEVIRGALLSVPRGEIEAARAFGYRGLVLIWRIWIPRAVQTMMPTFAGEAVLLLKATALASQVAVLDLLGQVNIIRAQTAITYTPLLVMAAGYLLTTIVIEAIFRRLEAHSAKKVRPLAT